MEIVVMAWSLFENAAQKKRDSWLHLPSSYSSEVYDMSCGNNWSSDSCLGGATHAWKLWNAPALPNGLSMWGRKTKETQMKC